MLPVALLAGGLATRLRPLTDRVPKSLLSIAGRPFIFHQLESLKRQGIKRIVLCVGHLGEQVNAVVGDGRGFGLAIQYSYDGNELLGTGGALKKALPLLGDEFFVLNGDSYLTCSFSRIRAAYEAAQRPALMTILRNENRWDRSNVLYENGEVIEYDKKAPQSGMEHIDYGLSVLSRAVFAKFGESKILDLADICRELAQSRQLAAFEVAERFYEVGSPQGIRETEEFLSRRLAVS
jgi:NDP-sugar pyrophosphorylase family protein